jgi:hypothetical protein
MAHFGDVNMTSAVMKGDFNGFLRAVRAEPADSQNNWRRRQFMDTVACTPRDHSLTHSQIVFGASCGGEKLS